MTVLITLTTAGADSGPFDLYTNLDGYVSAFATGVSKSALLAGYSSSAVPDFATIIRVKSTGDCVNYIDIVLTGLTTTTTTTTPLGCTAYTIYNGAGADEPYSYTACGGDFVGTFIGGFSSDGPFCAVTGSLVIGGSISITLEEPCSVPATTTTTTVAPGTGQVFINNVDTFGSIDDVQVNTSSIFITSGAFPVLGGESAQGNYGGAIPGLSTVGVFVSVSTAAPVNLSLSTGYTDCIVTSGYVEFTGVDLSTNANITISLQPQGSSCL